MSDNAARRPVRAPALLALALLSGAAALVYQVVWLRWFQLLFGSTAYAASATLCAFFTGLALGAALFGRVTPRWSRPLALYGLLELGAAAASVLVPLALRLYEPLYATLYGTLAERRDTFVAVKYGLALLAMLPASTLLGGTLPPLVAAFVRDARELGRHGNLLYTVNLLGAALGSALCAFWLIEAVGVPAAWGVALVLSLVAAAAALALAGGARVPATAPAPTPAARSAPVGALVVAFVSGFGTLALEVLLVHALAQTIDSSVYSFGAVLVVVLLALAAGAALVAATAHRVAAERLLVLALLAEAVLLLALPFVLVSGTDGLHRYVPGGLVSGLLLAASFGGPALLVGALVLPLTFRMAAGGAVGPRVGGLLAANTVGGILGSLLAGFVLLDRFGLWPSLALLGLGYGTTALAVPGSGRARLVRGAVVAAAALAVGAGPADPRALPLVALGAGERLVAVAEGAHGVVSVLESGGGERRIKVDNHYSLGGSRARVAQERAGHLPLLLHAAPQRVVFVGAATGGTAAAAVVHPVEQIALVELVPEVQELAARHFGFATRHVHRDPRTRLVVEDGRNHLRATRERYDVVVADLFVPWRPGAGSLYAREHFAAVRERLAPGGVFCQWIPLYQFRLDEFEMLVATFLDVFPEATLWRGDFFARRPAAALVGVRDSPLLPQAISERAARLATRGVEDRWVVDPEGLWMLYVGPLGPLRGSLAGVPRNTDDRPRFEFLAGRSRAEEWETFVREDWPAFVARVMRPPGAPDPALAGRPPEGPHRGALMARASLEAVQGRRAAFEATSRRIRRQVPAHLLEPPDPTVADAWPR